MFQSWLGSWRRRAHRRAVRGHVRYLLAGLPIADRRWVMRRVAGDSWQVVDKALAQGESEYETAVMYTGYLLTVVIEKVMAADERELIRGQLDAWTKNPRGDLRDALPHPWARGLALLERQTSTLVAEQRIRPYLQRFLLSEVAGALAGTPQQTRRDARMSSARAELRTERMQAAKDN